MKTHTQKLLAVSALYFSVNLVFAADATGSIDDTTVATAVAAPASVPANRIASRFEKLAGSPENAASLVAGMRGGSVITLGATDSAGGVRFAPATGQMGYGSITRALSLAERQLTAHGITEPTPEQLRIALNGGTLTSVDGTGTTRSVEMDGVLQLRSQSMGWGQIAHQLGVSPSNRPAPVTTGAARTTPPAVVGTDLRGNSRGQGAIVSGDGSILQGRSPGYGGATQGNLQAQSRTAAQAGSAAHIQSGRPSLVAAHSPVGTGNVGKGAIQGRGNGRL